MPLSDWARTIKQDAITVYLAARDPRTPWYAKALALLVAGYALSPIDLIPDFIPVLGLVDDLLLVPLGILLVVRLIPNQVLAESREAASQIAERPVSRAAAAVIAILWAASLALCAWLAYTYFVLPRTH